LYPAQKDNFSATIAMFAYFAHSLQVYAIIVLRRG
jgi:hypothetical protein